MSRRTIISLAATFIIGIGGFTTVSTDAFAYRAGVARAGVYHGGVYRGAAVRRGVAVGVGAAAVGAAIVGTAAALATAPYYAGGGPYAYYGYSGSYPSYGYSGLDDYAARNGFVCRPGTYVRLQDGLLYACQ
jgi:hypothetical protein